MISVVTLENRYAVTEADIEITCSISQLLKTVSVQWRDTDGQVISDDVNYTFQQGSKDESGYQYSTLIISAQRLQGLGSSVTYSCQVLSEDQTVVITKPMTLSIYTFSKYIAYVYYFYLCGCWMRRSIYF